MQSDIILAVQGRGTRRYPFKNQSLGDVIDAAQLAANQGTTIAIDGRVTTDPETRLSPGETLVVTNPIENG